MARAHDLTRSQARRIALAAQGFADTPHSTPTMRTFDRTLRRTGVLQVDSVNVLARAHLMPLYSRMGPYDTDLLRRASEQGPRRAVEYWAHVQALMPVDLWPAMAFRRAQYAHSGADWGIEPGSDLDARVLAAVAERGPVTARALEEEFATGPRTKEHWGWNWSLARRALDWLYRTGQVAVAGRNGAFEVLYDVTERVLPAEVLARPALDTAEAGRELVRRAARSHGIATEACLADYYRIRRSPGAEVPDARTAVAELVEAGELEPVRVQGWDKPAYRHHEARLPRRIPGRTLLSPFDPVVWERDRTEALFDFHYRIEIYTPAAQRRFGYYVLPFLLGEELVARVDLKADRRTGRLLVQGAFAEPGAPSGTGAELAAELRRLAGWLDVPDVVVQPHGDLAPALSVEVARG